MEEINERINEVVSQSKLTKTAFAKRLNVTQAYVSALCLGKKTPSDRTIVDICREFKVDEHWLRTGAGEMFRKDGDSVVDRLCAELHADELEAEIIRAYFRIEERIRLPLLRLLIQEVRDHPAEPDTTRQEQREAAAEIAPDVPGLDDNGLTPEETEELGRIRQEMIAKRGRTGQQSALPNANAS